MAFFPSVSSIRWNIKIIRNVRISGIEWTGENRNSSILGGAIYWTVQGEKIARLGDLRRLFAVSLFRAIRGGSYREYSLLSKRFCRGLMFLAEVQRQKLLYVYLLGGREVLFLFFPFFIRHSIIAVPF